MRGLARMAQRAAADPSQRRHGLQPEEPEDRPGAYAPAAADQPVEPCEQGWPRLDPGAERPRQRAADLFHARMHVFGGADDLVRPGADLAAHPLEPARADLQVGDADDVV